MLAPTALLISPSSEIPRVPSYTRLNSLDGPVYWLYGMAIGGGLVLLCQCSVWSAGDGDIGYRGPGIRASIIPAYRAP